MNTPPPQSYHQDHPSLGPTIDGLYIETVGAAANLNEYLINQVGMLREPFLSFYKRFNALFMTTHHMREMEPFKDTAEKIAKWCHPSNHIDRSKCLTGISLFDEWQANLFKAGVLSVRK